SGSAAASVCAAHASTGAVPRAAGSTSSCSAPSPAAARIGSASAAPVSTRIREAGTSGRMRSTVWRMRGVSPAGGNSCLGRAGVDTGQNREPTPPARITAQRETSVGEDLFDPGKELLGAEGLGQEVAGAEGGGLLAVGGLALAGEHDDGRVASMGDLAEAGEDLEAVHAGHHDVEQD